MSVAHAGRAGWLEICELTDVMNMHVTGLLAELAPSREEPGDQLLAGVGHPGRDAVVDDRGLLPFQGDSAEPGDQWLPACPLPDGLKADAWPVRSRDRGLVFRRDLRHRGAVL